MSGLATIKSLPVMSRMARAALNWSQQQAADEAEIPSITLKRFETATGSITVAKLACLIAAYERGGASIKIDADCISVSISHATAAKVADGITELAAARRRTGQREAELHAQIQNEDTTP